MNNILIAIMLIIFSCPYVNAQTSCEQITKDIKIRGAYITTDRSYFDDAISKVVFYKMTIDKIERFFAIVTFVTNTNKEYAYQIPQSAMDDYLSSYFKSDSEAFWSYIQPHSETLGCVSNSERESSLKPSGLSRCNAKTKSGKRCKRKVKEGGKCYQHE